MTAPPSTPGEVPGPVAAGSGADTDVLVRADGVQLLGEVPGSGYRRPPALARRGDGQVISLTPLLHQVLLAVDDRRTVAEVAEQVRTATGRGVRPEDVRQLVDTSLRPLGLLRRADGSEPEVRRSNPLLALKLRRVVTDPAVTRRLTAPFAVLFSPLIVVPVVVAFVAVSGWVLFSQGLAAATAQAFGNPALFLAVVVLTVLSAGFHEFGHAAAARYGGSTPGAMGFGFYLFWPAFYTDVTDSYTLGRAGRVRTDLGGLYFNALVVLASFGVWWLTGWHAVAVENFLQENRISRSGIGVIGFHGQTVLHRPEMRLTVQLGDGAALARRLQIPIVHDMRANDVAAGGQGAPLVPVYHRALAGLVKDVTLLRHDPDTQARLPPDAPFIGLRPSCQQPEQAGLARAITPDQADAAARLHHQIDAVEQWHMAIGERDVFESGERHEEP